MFPTRTLSCLFLLASLSAVACGPMIDPAAKADIDRRVAALRPSGQAFQPPTASLPISPAVGQWAQYRMTENGNPSFFTYKIVGVQDGAFWLAGLVERYEGRQIVKILIALPPDGNRSAAQIRDIVVSEGPAHGVQLDAALIALLQSPIGWTGQPHESVTVPAGSFADCFKSHINVNVAAPPLHSSIMAWSHPAVPLSGLVRSQRLDPAQSMELVAFGLASTPGTP